MTDVVTAHSVIPDSLQAGGQLGARVREALGGQSPDALVVFASPRHNYAQLLRALQDACEPGVLIGCSSAGEFTNDEQLTGAACVIAFRSSEMRFAAAVGRGLRASRQSAAEEMVSSFVGIGLHQYRYRTALVLVDALAGYVEAFVERLTALTGGVYRFFGGGAGDDARFLEAHLFHGTEVLTDAAVALEILSDKPIGIGVGHGWRAATNALRVTEAHATQLQTLNAQAAVEVMAEHAAATGQRFDLADPLPFFLYNVLGIATDGGHKLRVPLSALPDGALACAAETPVGTLVHVMQTTESDTITAAAQAARTALAQLGDHRPKAAIFFDCVATRLRMGRAFGGEVEAVSRVLGTAPLAGFNTCGQIARTDGQFNGFHNCTAVVCIIPE